MLQILAAPAVACLVMTGVLCYFGIHVIMREVIFVDLALAQVAAMGAAVAAWAGLEPHTPAAYACSLGFTLIGAALFALGRFRDARVPQEAVIGIVYAVSTAATLLVLSRLAVETDEIKHMLVGTLLFVGWREVGAAAVVCAVVGAVHVALRRRLLAISRATAERRGPGSSAVGWDFVFYTTLGLVVTTSVQMAGVLPVFSFLIVPAACAMIFFRSQAARLVAGWIAGIAGTALGLGVSVACDFPTGESVVTALGLLFAACSVFHVARRRRTARPH
jgi:zinc/manganese transport system permease protein